MLDGPYANSTWNGREIAVVEVPANARRERVTINVATPDVEGLKGKHAIYLVAEGPEVKEPHQAPTHQQRGPRQPQRPVGLFDLHGIGFAKDDAPVTRPVVPTVAITVDGQKLNIPDTPIRTTNANGLTDAIRYQVYGPLKQGSKISVTASDPSVKSDVSSIVEGRCTVKCTYNGKEKIFLIN